MDILIPIIDDIHLIIYQNILNLMNFNEVKDQESRFIVINITSLLSEISLFNY